MYGVCVHVQVVTDRGFRHGDVAVVDFAASVAGASIPGLTRPKMRIDSNEPEQLPGGRFHARRLACRKQEIKLAADLVPIRNTCLSKTCTGHAACLAAGARQCEHAGLTPAYLACM